MKREAFETRGLRIETARDDIGRWFVCWKPHVSVYVRERRELLRFASWPAKTPTGDSLRSWLDSLAAADAEQQQRRTDKLKALEASEGLSEAVLATGFGPEVFAGELDPSDPNHRTRTVL